MFSEILAGRALGAFPLSIATSIAFEHLLGVKSEANPEPKPNAVGKYSEIWVNLKTLYRNMLGSVPRDKAGKPDDKVLSMFLHIEMETIVRIVSEYSNGTCRPVFFVSNYDFGFWKFANVQLRTDNTEIQKFFTQQYKDSIKLLLKKGPVEGSDLFVFDRKLKPPRRIKAILLSHMAYDLVSANQFDDLDLLESHTGAIKGKDKWYTKYYDGKELEFIPFVDILLPVFGDNETFRPMLKSARNEVIEVARKFRWNSVTTREKIIYGINTLKNQYLIDVIHSLK